MSKHRIGMTVLAIALLSIFWIAPAQAQGGGWSEPFRLSSQAGRASEATLVADQYGYVHCFWSETLFENQHTILQYARFDGGTWSAPNDIHITSNEIKSISAVVDQHGTLHIVWIESVMGGNGRVFYSYAPASNALSVQNWAPPLRIPIPAGIVQFRVDSRGVFHILYVNRSEELGVYYVRSEDQGQTWSEPLWLDPDILPAHTPDNLNFELDENDGLHAVWFYGALEHGERPDWVRYSHSLDGGDTWSEPFMIDQYVEGGHHNLTNAGPVMIVQGQTVHVIWAGGELGSRYHRFSTDAGLTWSPPNPILGELHGQAGDGLAIDGAGRVHYLAQIRYPLGIYETTWDKTQWTPASLIYLIAQEGAQPISEAELADSVQGQFGDRVHAHHTHPVVRAGNQLVLTFADGPSDPNRRLFVMYHSLADIAPLETIPAPTPAATLIPPPSPTPTQPEPTPTATATPPLMDVAGPEPGEMPKADSALQFGLVPVLLLLLGTFVFRWWYNQKP
jgi:hypothetical protein